MKEIALRIDVDTYRGTRDGVPQLCRTLAKHGVKGTFYFSVGPDNMGRHLWRLLKPAFLWKMLRTNAAGLYGLDIVLMGTAWPGPRIGKRLAPQIRAAAEAGHEIGFHAWDHHFAQAHIDTMSDDAMREEFRRGLAELERIVGFAPRTSATPGWRTTDRLLRIKTEFPFDYNSDCRGYAPFKPDIPGAPLQIPVTLPTYDEICGRDGVNDANYNDRQIALLREDRLNVLTIHAEAEGGRCSAMFDDYLSRVLAAGYEVFPLGEAARRYADAPVGSCFPQPFPGREGWLSVQSLFFSR